MKTKRLVQISSILAGVVSIIIISAAIGVERPWATKEEQRILEDQLETNMVETNIRIQLVAGQSKENLKDILEIRLNSYVDGLVELERELESYRNENRPEPSSLKKLKLNKERSIETIQKKLDKLEDEGG